MKVPMLRLDPMFELLVALKKRLRSGIEISLLGIKDSFVAPY
jgi:hypothetical protein